VFLVFVQVLAVDQNIVEICCTEEVEVRAQYVVHKVLECAQGIS
jgi:hypothetical protein